MQCDLMIVIGHQVSSSRLINMYVHDVSVQFIKRDRAVTKGTTAPEGVAVHVECQMIPLIAGVMNLRMMPQPKY
jgi:hypothetical protein